MHLSTNCNAQAKIEVSISIVLLARMPAIVPRSFAKINQGSSNMKIKTGGKPLSLNESIVATTACNDMPISSHAISRNWQKPFDSNWKRACSNLPTAMSGLARRTSWASCTPAPCDMALQKMGRSSLGGRPPSPVSAMPRSMSRMEQRGPMRANIPKERTASSPEASASVQSRTSRIAGSREPLRSADAWHRSSPATSCASRALHLTSLTKRSTALSPARSFTSKHTDHPSAQSRMQDTNRLDCKTPPPAVVMWFKQTQPSSCRGTGPVSQSSRRSPSCNHAWSSLLGCNAIMHLTEASLLDDRCTGKCSRHRVSSEPIEEMDTDNSMPPLPSCSDEESA
mmetsp:Transcript_130920/g.407137  ORF Transcript_130920/g.407137 Transcript_130920/m.407137 type:complete len:340 (+) Transcript_130920:701-1720(+)